MMMTHLLYASAAAFGVVRSQFESQQSLDPRHVRSAIAGS
jgi:hypothetical protein